VVCPGGISESQNSRGIKGYPGDEARGESGELIWKKTLWNKCKLPPDYIRTLAKLRAENITLKLKLEEVQEKEGIK
jgi:hypothetical protein